MKFALAYYIILIYATVILKPLIPIDEYGIQHCFAEAYHIATVHAKYGNNHLEKELENANDNTDNISNKNILIDEDSASLHIISTIENIPVKAGTVKTTYIIQSALSLQKILLSKIFPPPNFLK